MQKPNATLGLRHVALFIENFAACEKFYLEFLNMTIDWRPDADNLYLTTGHDNFALHRAAEKKFSSHGDQRLDHIGFFLQSPEDVDAWFEYAKFMQVKILAQPKDHRDGTRSFYCADPDGNAVQMIYVPPKK